MGVDYYNCERCGEIFAYYGEEDEQDDRCVICRRCGYSNTTIMDNEEEVEEE